MSGRLGALLFSLLLWAGLATSAAALETGSHAWTLYGVTLHEGPGGHYHTTGEVSGEIKIRVDRCSFGWCRIRGEGQQGWVRQAALTFGEYPLGPFEGPGPSPRPHGGGVCLYSGPNYTGLELCRSSGYVARDLLLLHVDNNWSSLRVTGTPAITLCRDAYFLSYCQVFTADTPRLPRFLDNSVSSLRIY